MSRPHPAPDRAHASMPRTSLAVWQGGFWLATGIWPLLHRASFEAVTGPKTDFWLVETAGLLIAVIGAVVLLAWARRRITLEIAALGLIGAVGLAAIETYYAAFGRISRIYLCDAIVELVFAIGWSFWLLPRRGRATNASITPSPGQPAAGYR